MTTATDLTITPSAIHDPALGLHNAFRRGALVAVLQRRATERGKGEEWVVLWKRAAEGGWAPGDGTAYPDAERAADSALAAVVDAAGRAG